MAGLTKQKARPSNENRLLGFLFRKILVARSGKLCDNHMQVYLLFFWQESEKFRFIVRF
jgi:hypothetical protein